MATFELSTAELISLLIWAREATLDECVERALDLESIPFESAVPLPAPVEKIYDLRPRAVVEPKHEAARKKAKRKSHKRKPGSRKGKRTLKREFAHHPRKAKAFGLALKEAREKLGFKQDEAAALLNNKSGAQVSQWETGKWIPKDPTTIAAIKDNFGVDAMDYRYPVKNPR